MARFPTTESEVVTLAQKVVSGFQAHDTVYPTPPVSAERLDELMRDYNSRLYAATNMQAATAQAITAKNDAFRALTEGLKTDLRYAENTVNDDDDKLKMIGWGGKAARTTLVAPGQPRAFVVSHRSNTTITLSWKAPEDGGRVGGYCVQRREWAASAWTSVVMVFETQATLTEQPRGTTCEYRVTAMNKAGEGEASGIVEVIF